MSGSPEITYKGGIMGVQRLHIKVGQRRIEFGSLIEYIRYKESFPVQMIYPYPQQGNRAGIVVKQVLYPQQDGSLWSKFWIR